MIVYVEIFMKSIKELLYLTSTQGHWGPEMGRNCLILCKDIARYGQIYMIYYCREPPVPFDDSLLEVLLNRDIIQSGRDFRLQERPGGMSYCRKNFNSSQSL